MTTQQPSGWFGADVVAMLPSQDPGDEPDLAKRVEAVLGTTEPDPRSPDGIWQPSPLGEVLTTSIVALLVRAAPSGTGVAAYAACEDDGALDRIMDALQRAVVRELRKVAKA